MPIEARDRDKELQILRRLYQDRYDDLLRQRLWAKAGTTARKRLDRKLSALVRLSVQDGVPLDAGELADARSLDRPDPIVLTRREPTAGEPRGCLATLFGWLHR